MFSGTRDPNTGRFWSNTAAPKSDRVLGPCMDASLLPWLQDSGFARLQAAVWSEEFWLLREFLLLQESSVSVRFCISLLAYSTVGGHLGKNQVFRCVAFILKVSASTSGEQSGARSLFYTQPPGFRETEQGSDPLNAEKRRRRLFFLKAKLECSPLTIHI